MLVNLARLVFNQSCSVLRSVVSRRLVIIVLMLSFSSATSPRASTWIERVRSPLVTAVATSAIARTCDVRFAASRLTLPVRSFHVPAAPGTLAWPPSRPSTPTSRATLVTWSAKVARVSVMLLIVSASAATSPFDFTVRFCLRSPSATAVTTFTMPRTCSVRLAAKLAFGADFAGNARDFAGKSVELVHHRIDGVLEFENFALHIDGDLARQIAPGHSRSDFSDVSDLAGQVSAHRVHG